MLHGFKRLRHALGDAMRGAVRCAFPAVTLAALAVLLFCDQGQDVLRAMVEALRTDRGGFGGFVFLGAGITALSFSLWYAMRWLLTAQMPGVPLDDTPGLLRRWLPRLAGGAAPGLVAWALANLGGAARVPAWCFAALAAVLVAVYAVRGHVLLWFTDRGWLARSAGRAGARPGVIGVDEKLPATTLRFVLWSLLLTLLLAALITLFPVTLPRVIGGAAVAAFSLASINLFGSFALTYLPLRNGLPHLAPWVLLWAGVIGAFNDNHAVQPAASSRASRLPPAEWPVVDQDFPDFLQQLGGSPTREVTVFFVASEGGGIRAAYWTAAVLESLRRQVPEFETHVYAMSGVSGGSLGIAAWVAARKSDRCGPPDRSAPSATRSLSADFVSPAIAGLLYYDLAQRFIPWPIESFDRSRALEGAWQSAFHRLPGRPFEGTLDDLYRGCERLPHLLLNATVVETGQRAVLTRLVAPKSTVDTFDAMNAKYTARTQSLAGLVHHSARFPLVSPAGTIETIDARGKRVPAFRLVDGGYFDNSGAQTALELIRELRLVAARSGVAFRPVLLLVRNDAREREPPQVGGWFPETGSIIGALYNARSAHAVLARETAIRELGTDVVDLAVPPEAPAASAPLGWALSDAVREALDQAAREVAEREAGELRQRLKPSERVR